MTQVSIHNKVRDYTAFAHLPDKVRTQVTTRLDFMERINNCGHGQKGTLVASAAVALNVSPVTVNRLLKQYREQGWEGLIDGRHKGGQERGLPQGFKQYVRGLHLSIQGRKTTGAEVRKQVIERWHLWNRTGDPKYAVPGYDTPPKAGNKTGYPSGWSYDQLACRLRPEDYAVTIARKGEKAATKFLPNIRKTRVGVLYGAVVFIDDDEPDIQVVAPGLSVLVVRPQCFTAVDYLSGDIPANVIRWRVKGENDGKRKSMNIRNSTWFVVDYLLNHGYRTDEQGTVIVMEWGTANTFGSTVENPAYLTGSGHYSFGAAIGAITNGKVTEDRSGRYNKPIYKEMLYGPSSSGNPNHKSPVESLFNLIRNRMATFRGAIGMNRDNRPAEYYGVQKHDEKLLNVYLEQPEHIQKAILFEHLTTEEFARVYFQCFRAVRDDTDHNLQGWTKCKFDIPVFRWSEETPWISFPQMEEQIDRAPHLRAVAHQLKEDPQQRYTKTQRLARSHITEMHSHELTKLKPEMVPLILPKSWARPLTVKSDNTISFIDKDIDSEPLEYAVNFKSGITSSIIKTGTTILVFVNAMNPTTVYCTDQDGRWLGTLTQWTRADYHDTDRIEEQLAERSHMKAALDATVRPALQGEAQARKERNANNDRALSGNLPINDRTGDRPPPKRTKKKAPDPADILAKREARKAAQDAAAERD